MLAQSNLKEKKFNVSPLATGENSLVADKPDQLKSQSRSGNSNPLNFTQKVNKLSPINQEFNQRKAETQNVINQKYTPAIDNS